MTDEKPDNVTITPAPVHPLVGKYVRVITGEKNALGEFTAQGIVERVVPSRFGFLAYLDISGDYAYSVGHCTVFDDADLPNGFRTIYAASKLDDLDAAAKHCQDHYGITSGAGAAQHMSGETVGQWGAMAPEWRSVRLMHWLHSELGNGLMGFIDKRLKVEDLERYIPDLITGGSTAGIVYPGGLFIGVKRDNPPATTWQLLIKLDEYVSTDLLDLERRLYTFSLDAGIDVSEAPVSVEE